MGNEQAKNKKFNPKNIDKSKLDIVIKQIYFTAQLNRDRRRGQQLTREKELLNLFREPANKRNKDNEYHKASAIVNDIKWIKAQEFVMRYADILKDNEMIIMLSKGDMTKINDLIPYVESIIWGCQKGNIDCVREFQAFIAGAFGPEVLAQLLKFTLVTAELKECYAAILPSEKEIKSYLIDFCGRNGISLETMNEIGHGLSLAALEDIPGPTNPSNPSNPSTGPSNNSTGGPGQQYPGNYPPNNFPNQGYPGYNQPPNNYMPGGFPNYPQGGFQPQGGYPQNGYPQGGFPSYPQGGFPQNGYPSGGFPSDGFSQGGPYPGGNGGNPQGNYPQGGNAYPQFGDIKAQSSPYEPYKQAPEPTNFQAPSNPSFNVKPEQPQSSLPDSGAYPAFQKFTNNGPSAKVGGDPLDELDMRLRDIKSGL